jgi:hypothetical protein
MIEFAKSHAGHPIRTNPDVVQKGSFEFVEIPVQNGGHRSDLFREKSQIQFGVALLDHPAQKTWRIDPPLGFVHRTAIARHFGGVTRHAFVVIDELLAQFQVRTMKDRWLRIHAHRSQRQPNTQQPIGP